MPSTAAPSPTLPTPRTLLSRLAVGVLAVLCVLGALFSLFTGALAWSTQDRSPSLDVAVGQRPDVQPDLHGTQRMTFTSSEWSMLTDEVPASARPYLAFATYAPYVTAALALLTIAGLAVMLLRRRPFGVVTCWWVTFFGASMTALAVAQPWAASQAATRWIEWTGAPTEWEHGASQTWIVTPGQSIENTGWKLLLIGGIVALTGLFLLRARRLQADTDGLV